MRITTEKRRKKNCHTNTVKNHLDLIFVEPIEYSACYTIKTSKHNTENTNQIEVKNKIERTSPHQTTWFLTCFRIM